MLARSRQLEGIFGLLKPFLHVQILICFVDVYQNHGVCSLMSRDCVFVFGDLGGLKINITILSCDTVELLERD